MLFRTPNRSGLALRVTPLWLVICAAAVAQAQDCFDYTQPGPDGSVQGVDLLLGPTGFQVSSIHTHGEYLGLRYFDMNGSIRGVAFYSLDQTGELTYLTHHGGSAGAVDVDFALGYGDGSVATYRRRMSSDTGTVQENHVLDLAGEGLPRGLLGDYGPTWILHGRAYVEAANELRVYDLQDIEAPEFLAVIAVPSGVKALFDVEGRLAVITDSPGLEVWDVTSAGSFTRLASRTLDFDPSDIAAGDGFLLATTRSAGLFKIDMSNPSEPVVPAAGQDLGLLLLESVAVSGTYAYVTWIGGLRALDLTREPPLLLPAQVATEGGRIRMGRNRIFVLMVATLYAAPVDCGNVVPTARPSLGGLKALFR